MDIEKLTRIGCDALPPSLSRDPSTPQYGLVAASAAMILYTERRDLIRVGVASSMGVVLGLLLTDLLRWAIS